MKYKVCVYLGFGDGYEKQFKTRAAALKFQDKVRKESGGPKHFVKVYEKISIYQEIG